MAEPELHYPPGAEPNPPTPEPEPTPEPTPDPEPTPEPTPEPKPEETPEPKPDEPAPEVPLPKPRSIYDDLKDTRKEKNAFKAAAVAALEAQGVKLTGKETAEELQALAKKTPSSTPAPETPAPSEPTDELEAYAKENNLDSKALAHLADIIAKRVPQADLTKEERQQLAELKTWQTDQLAKEQRTTEDNAIKAEAPKVKEQLQVHDDAELAAVMDEIVRLAHTPEFHDKEVEYIVWKNQAKLAKLVSPKKPSFESGGPQATPEPAAEPDFSSNKGITPAMAEKAAHQPKGSALEIRRGK